MSQGESTPAPPSGPHASPGDEGNAAVLLVVGVGTLLGALAGSSVTVALPHIGSHFGLSIASVRWVVSAYLVAVTTLLLPAGRLGDLLGHRVVYLTGFALFGVTSLLCGLAPSFSIVVLGRVLQGIGAALLMATGPALLTTNVPGHRRGRALGMVATATYAGLTVGPSLGGFLVDVGSWRWVFFVNVPVTLAVCVLGALALPPSPRQRASFDGWGTVALLLGFTPLLVTISHGGRGAGLPVPLPVLGGVGVLGMGAFAWIQRRAQQPLVRFGVFLNKTFTTAVLSATGNYVALFIPIILTPFFLTEGVGLTPGRTGLVLSSQPVIMALVASPSGWLSDRVGTRPLAASGMFVMAAGLFGLSWVGAESSPYVVAGWLGVAGLGTGMFISPNSSALMGSAPKSEQGIAGGILAVARNLGMLLGVAAATGFYSFHGGQTGAPWAGPDFRAYSLCLRYATVAALLSGLVALFGGSPASPNDSAEPR